MTRESREDVGEVVVSYDADGVLTCEVTLSPVEVSKLETEISADRLKKIHRIKNNKLRIINWAIVQFILFLKPIF